MTLLQRWKVATIIIGGLAAALGVITAAHTAFPIIDPYLVAHRGYVVEKIGGVQATTNELLLWKSEDTKAKLKADINGWSIQLQRETDPQTKSLIQRQIEQLNIDQQVIDERIRKLRSN